MQSGKASRFDDASPEARFFDMVAGELIARGVGTLQLDVAPRTADAAFDVADRTERLRLAIHTVEDQPLVLFGLSLGAQSVLRLLGEPSPPARLCGAVLASCVIEAPAFVTSDVRAIELVYGARDFIGYVEQGSDAISLLAPEQYAVSSRDHLVVRRGCRLGLHILDGVGHLMDSALGAGLTASTVAGLVVGIMESHGTST